MKPPFCAWMRVEIESSQYECWYSQTFWFRINCTHWYMGRTDNYRDNGLNQWGVKKYLKRFLNINTFCDNSWSFFFFHMYQQNWSFVLVPKAFCLKTSGQISESFLIIHTKEYGTDRKSKRSSKSINISPISTSKILYTLHEIK